MPRHVPATQSELSRVGLLAELPGEELSRLASRMLREDVATGDAPVVEGDEGDRFYVVLSGMFAVKQLRNVEPKRYLRPGDYFGRSRLRWTSRGRRPCAR
jgi:CRP-like cAMP-binding protein